MKVAESRFLVAGATGFIGRHVVAALLSAGADVHLMAFVNRGHPDRLSKIRNATIHRITPPDGESMAACVQAATPDVIINLAATGVSPTDRAPHVLLDGNPGFLSSLLLAAATMPPRRVLHIGSWLEYSSPPSGTPVTEDHPLRPSSLYGGAKAAATLFGHALADHLGVRMTTLRLFHVFGPDEAPQRLTTILKHRLSHGEPCPLSGGEQVRDMMFVRDAAEAVLAACEADSLAEPVYNVCTGKGVTVREFAERVAVVLGAPKNLLQFGSLAYRADEAMWMVGDGTRFHRDTGWRPRHDLETGILASLG